MPNRYVCSALSELRTILELQGTKYEMSSRDQACIMLLIEEVQVYVNRMEDSLGDKWDMIRLQEDRCKLSKKRRQLREEVARLQEEIADMTEDEEEEDEDEL